MAASSEYIPDCLFPSDNELEVPALLPDVQPEFCEIPFVCWGETARTFQMNGHGTLHFYTDDYRFSAVFEHPEKILQMSPANIVEPNFSLYAETPVAFGLQQIYKKRLVARMAYLEFEHALAKSWAGDNADRMLFVIYGGGNQAKEFARKNRCVYVEMLVNVKNKMRSLEHHLSKIQDTIAFSDEDVRAIVSKNADIKQLYDFSQLNKDENTDDGGI